MLASKSFVRKTKKGNVVKVVKEHYLRDDIYCGLEVCPVCQNDNPILSKEAEHYVILDTNVIVHQIDLIEHEYWKNVIILGTVLEEVKHLQLNIYNRLRQLTANKERRFYVFSNEFHKETYIERDANESINDRNDRAIRVATNWYSKHFGNYGNKVMLLTNDVQNLQKAQKDGIQSMKVIDYVEKYTSKYPELTSLLVDLSSTLDNDGDTIDNKKIQFNEYYTKIQVETGIKNGTIIQGPLRMNRFHTFEGYVPANIIDDKSNNNNNNNKKDILISGIINLNRAIQGDIVAVKLLPKEEWKKPSIKFLEDDEIEEEGETKENNIDIVVKQKSIKEGEEKEEKEVEGTIPTGIVVGIIKRNWKPYCGSIEINENNNNNNSSSTSKMGNNVLFRPVDKSIPKIRIRTKQIEEIKNKRIVVSIDTWDINSKYPTGHYVRTLGNIGDKDVETELILLQHDIPYQPFTESVLNCLPSSDWTATKDIDFTNKQRKDLRDITVFSVDPPGCTDIDDALHVIQLENGNYEVGVHIADVTYFMKENTPLDKEAQERCTTVYLVNRRIEMLPSLLSGNLCSLMCDVDRFAFSVIWEMTSDGKVVKTEFTKSTIRSKASLTYEAAQLRIDDVNSNDDISKSLRILLKLSKKLKEKRIEEGAITLSSPEVKFIKDEETQNPLDVEMYQLRETNSMVEEFMLLANIHVAIKIHDHFPSFALLRRHPTPNPHQFDNLIDSLKPFNLTIDITNSKTLANSLDNAIIKENKYFNTLVRILTTRCMSPAVYFSSGTVPQNEYRHYGLAIDIYTHFTSPIRRYADDIVHRLLACAIGVYPLSPNLDKIKVQKSSDVMNYRHKMAQYASRNSVELYTLLYFKDKLLIEDAYITKVRANGFTAIIPKYGVEGKIQIDINHNNVNYDLKSQTLKVNELSFAMFQKITVEITVNNKKNELQLLCLNPPVHTPTEPSTTNSNKTNDKRNITQDSEIDGLTPNKKLKSSKNDNNNVQSNDIK